MTQSRCSRLPQSRLVFLAAFLFAGCGGGSLGEGPPPPQPDFSLTVSSSTLTIDQGATSSAIQVGVQPLNGFSGSVDVTVAGIPQGVNTNPESPFSIVSGGNVSLLVGASSSAAVGNSIITVQGSSGGLSHSQSVNLTVQSNAGSGVPRTNFFRTDSQALLDDPSGEPHHRHMVYDLANQHLFVANRARNRVEVFSTASGAWLNSIDVAGASSVDVSADGKSIWVGTATEQIATIDTGTLQVTKRFSVIAIEPIPNVVFDRPEEVLALSGGKLLVRLRQANGTQALLALWDPATNFLTDLTSLAPPFFQNGLGVMARSSDHSKAFVAANDASGQAMVLDGSAAVVVAPAVLGSGSVIFAASNSDGSQFAAVLNNGGAQEIVVLNATLQVQATRATSGASGVVFSRDGQSVFLAENSTGNAVLSVLAASDLHSVSAAADVAIQGVRSEIEEADETGLVLGLSNRGISFLDGSVASTFNASVPTFAAAPAVSPASGANAGGTVITLSGENFGASPGVFFGGQPAAGIASSSSTQIQASTPPNVWNGAVNVLASFSGNGGIAIAPDAFSYGPQILEILPNAGQKTGGDSVAIYGYGFGDDPSQVTVQFGATAANVQKIETVPAINSSLALDPNFAFPLQRLTVTSPSGSAGKVDVNVNSPAGSIVAKGAFQYVQSAEVFAKPGFYKFILYDQGRQWVYLSNIDHLDVFDLAAGSFRVGILPPGGPPPDALIRQAALTPDGSQLAVADFGAQSVYVFNPDTGMGSTVRVGGISGDLNSGPVRVAATAANTVFVGLASYDASSSGCGNCLQQMNLSSSPVTVGLAPQSQVSGLTSAPMLDASASGDAAFLSFSAAPGAPMASWSSNTPGQFSTAQTSIAASDLATAGDGTFVALRNGNAIEIRDANLALQSVSGMGEIERIPQRTEVPGAAMHPSGALLYVPFLTGPPPASGPFTGLQGGVDILDAHSGRLRMRVNLPEPLAMLAADTDGLHARFLAADENGTRIFAITASGLTVIQLANAPLGIGTLSPVSGPAPGGTTLTLRGSGFQAGTTLTLGGISVAATFVDGNTLKFTSPATSVGSQQLIVTNPDGETVSLDAAFDAD